MTGFTLRKEMDCAGGEPQPLGSAGIAGGSIDARRGAEPHRGPDRQRTARHARLWHPGLHDWDDRGAGQLIEDRHNGGWRECRGGKAGQCTVRVPIPEAQPNFSEVDGWERVG